MSDYHFGLNVDAVYNPRDGYNGSGSAQDSTCIEMVHTSEWLPFDIILTTYDSGVKEQHHFDEVYELTLLQNGSIENQLLITGLLDIVEKLTRGHKRFEKLRHHHNLNNIDRKWLR